MNIKNVFLICALLLGINSTNAQVNVNINIGSQPLWGPVGYNHVDYYYLPEIETYYYVPKRQFIYINGGNWVFSTSLPYRHRHYNLYNGYKVVINQPYAYKHHKHYKVKYAHHHRHGYQPTHREHRYSRPSHDYKKTNYHYRQQHDYKKHKGNGKHHPHGGKGRHGKD